MYEIDFIDFILGIVVGLTAGLVIGYVSWHRKPKKHINKLISEVQAKRLSQLQIMSFVMFVAYLSTPLFGLPNPDPVIAIGILALVSGESLGGAIAQVIEKNKGKK